MLYNLVASKMKKTVHLKISKNPLRTLFITKGLWRTMVWSAGVKFTVKGKMASKKEAPIVTGIDKLLYLMKGEENYFR